MANSSECITSSQEASDQFDPEASANLSRSRVLRTQENNRIDKHYSQMMSKPLDSELEDKHRRPRLKKIVSSPMFGFVTSLLILINMIVIGIETDHAQSNHASSRICNALEVMFAVLYSIELAMRFLVDEWASFRDNWFVFDLSIITASLINLVVAHLATEKDSRGSQGAVIIMLRVLRLFKIARLIRLIRCVRELVLLVSSLLSAMRTLLWTFVLLCLMIYGFSILYTQVLGQYEELQEYFSSVHRSGFTLFGIMTLDNWVPVTRLVWRREAGMVWVTAIFITLTSFAIMNVVIAVIVESTLKDAMKNEEDRLKELEKEMHKATSDVMQVFIMCDTNHDGLLTKKEFTEALKDPSVERILKSLDIDFDDLSYLFNTLDFNQDGVITVHEFVQGTLQVRGVARARRVFELHCAVDEIGQRIQKLESGQAELQMNAANEAILQERRTEKVMLKIDRLEDMLSKLINSEHKYFI